jgi:hypothetical protein
VVLVITFVCTVNNCFDCLAGCLFERDIVDLMPQTFADFFRGDANCFNVGLRVGRCSRNKERMIELLGNVDLGDQAEWITDTILANP